jgi:hypothetical protein
MRSVSILVTKTLGVTGVYDFLTFWRIAEIEQTRSEFGIATHL